jgi:hypothetical protein
MKEPKTYVRITINEEFEGDEFEGTSGPINVSVSQTFRDPTVSDIEGLCQDALRAAGFFPNGR